MSEAEEPKPEAAEAFMPLVYDELRAIAHSYIRRQPPSFTLQPTEIVNEACMHLLRRTEDRWESPEHFRAIATRKLWQVIVDHLKRRQAQKRGGAAPQAADAGAPASMTGETAGPSPRPHRRRIAVETVAVEWRDRTVDLLDLAEALEALTAESGRLADVVKLHWFGGLTYAQVAGVMGLSSSTVEKDFHHALAWLNRRLTDGAGHVH